MQAGSREIEDRVPRRGHRCLSGGVGLLGVRLRAMTLPADAVARQYNSRAPGRRGMVGIKASQVQRRCEDMGEPKIL